MKVSPTALEGLFILEPRVFEDARGYFFESFNEKRLKEQGLTVNFVQDNQSLSQKGALRGLHFQAPPHGQIKLVQVIRGAALDVVVDIRKHSATYGQHFQLLLSEKNKQQLFIPEGFAHGFIALEDQTIFSYKCSDFYAPGSEGGVYWADPDLGIDWGDIPPVLSEKDQGLPAFRDFVSPF